MNWYIALFNFTNQLQKIYQKQEETRKQFNFIFSKNCVLFTLINSGFKCSFSRISTGIKSSLIPIDFAVNKTALDGGLIIK